MTAAAIASQLASGTDDRWLALAAIVAGGLIEGVVLGTLQAAVLGRWLPRLHRYAWVVVTTAVAGLGWAAASAPSQFGGTDGNQPVLGVVLLGAVALGAVMGVLLGAAQFLVLRGAVPRPARWIAVSALAWAPAMAIIFVGATAPDRSWSTPGILAVAATTGALAGAVLGAISGALSPWLAGRSASNQIILGILRSRWHSAIDRNIIGLRMLGRRTGRTLELPVQYVTLGDRLVIYPHAAQRKNWWRNLIDPVSLEVLVHGRWTSATGHVVTGGDPSWELARSAYIGRWPRITIAKDAPLAVVELHGNRLNTITGPL